MKNRLLLISLICFYASNLYCAWEVIKLPDGGNFNSLCVLQGDVYCGNEAGVFVTKDKGISWTKLPFDQTVKYIASSGENLIVATGSDNNLYCSTDKGQTWNWDGWNNAHSDLFIGNFSVDGKNVVIGSNSWGIFRSNDYGKTFSRIRTQTYSQGDRELLTKNNFIYSSGYNGDQIIFSKDSGNTWVQTESKGLESDEINCFCSVNNSVLAGTSNGIFKTTLGDTTWTKVNTGSFQSSVIKIIYENDVIYAGTDKGVLMSKDKGITWKSISPEFNANALAVASGILYASKGDGLMISGDNGITWTSSKSGLLQGSRIVFANKNRILTQITSGLIYSDDSGKSWEPTNIKTYYPQSYYSSIISIDDILYFSVSDGLFISKDNGATWENESNKNGLPVINYNNFKYYQDANHISYNDKYVFFKAGRAIYAKDRNLPQWTLFDTTGLGRSSRNSVSIAANNSVLCMITWDNQLFRYDFKEKKWGAISLPDVKYINNLNSINDTIYVLTGNNKLFRSVDFKSDIEDCSLGLNLWMCNLAGSNGKFFMNDATESNILYYSFNNCLYWCSISDSVPAKSLHSLSVANGNIYIASNAGILKRKIEEFSLIDFPPAITSYTIITKADSVLHLPIKIADEDPSKVQIKIESSFYPILNKNVSVDGNGENRVLNIKFQKYITRPYQANLILKSSDSKNTSQSVSTFFVRRNCEFRLTKNRYLDERPDSSVKKEFGDEWYVADSRDIVAYSDQIKDIIKNASLEKDSSYIITSDDSQYFYANNRDIATRADDSLIFNELYLKYSLPILCKKYITFPPELTCENRFIISPDSILNAPLKIEYYYPDSLQLTAISSNQNVVWDSKIMITGSGSDRNINITPENIAKDSCEINLKAKDKNIEAIITLKVIVQSPTGINDIIPDNKFFSLSPNPVHEKFTINFGSGESEFNRVEIFDLPGNLVHIGIYSGASIEIDTGALPRGIYYCRITNGSKSFVEKLIKVE